jgi:glycosyltransferase involved in cell wall biosynthesis
MRIAEVAPPWLAVPPRGYGGIEWVVALLADGLTERGHDVTLFATGDSVTKAHLDYVFERAPGPQFINDIWHDTVHTLHTFRGPDVFDVYHVHSPWSSLILPAALGVPTVHTVHGSFTPEMRRLYSALGNRVWFVAVSETQRDQMPGLNYAGVVYNGVDVDLHPFREDKEDFVLFLGRAAPEKGVLRAVLAAREAGERLVLAVKVAHETEVEHWNREVLPALPEDATVLTEVTFAEKLDLLSRAKAVLFPIDWDEPFGLVMVEAMACGTPVIATSRGSVREIVVEGETGFVLPVEDFPQRAAEALRRVGELDPKASRRRVEERFSKRVMVEGYERVFECVLASTSVPAAGLAAAGSRRPHEP